MQQHPMPVTPAKWPFFGDGLMWYLRCVLTRIAALLLIHAPLAIAQETPLKTLAEVRALSSEKAAEKLPVEVEGIVTYFDRKVENIGDPEGLILHDGTAGCYASSPLQFANREKIRPGTRIRVKGVTNPRSYFPNIMGAEMEVLGQGDLPEPRRITGGDMFTRWIDAEWVEVEAVLVGLEPGGLAFTVVVEIDGRTFKAEIPEVADAEQRVASLMQRRVRLRGVVGTISNNALQMTDRHFFVPSFDQIVPIDSISRQRIATLRTIGTLLRSDHGPDEMVRVKGVVTQLEGGGLFLRDETGSTFVQAAEGQQHPPGSEVEVEGFATVAPFRPVLRAVRIESLGEVGLPDPIRFQPANGINVSLHDERVVVDCIFLARREGLKETALQCRDGDRYFEAWLPGPNRHGRTLKTGDQVRLTGIFEVTTTRPMPRIEWADGMRIHLAGPGAVEVLRPAPWWTPERVLLAFGLALAVLIVALVWVWLLRRRIAAQAVIITEQIEKATIKDERDRIARELHDTLEQDLTGLSMQLGNLAPALDGDPELAHQRLSLARRMLQHCRAEARASVGDLRNPHLLKRSLPEAMRESLPVVAGEAALRFEVDGKPRPLRATTQNHLLRIAREAVNNAARHSQPRHIGVRLSYDSEGVTLEVKDDGKGFDATRPAPAGHFGLTGMRERADKIHADFAIESSPGKSTRIRVHLPWTSPVVHPRRRS
ncbi:sensor histidine kinase [Haloferula sp. A504]|uniref:sensor histidine kinase n=1 Tax=Haloferula sp. A504 TaxID=3373601 RepID=UPI0031CBDCC1|nr:sensor histidine kinase [Verrucomicrobiaceae bacterium E54]